jgi:AcrR family transcriptional regulator
MVGTKKSPVVPPAPKRRDARRSYDALVSAARAAFEEHGLDASLDDIARAAGVGNATLYRHFPSRYQLLAVAHAESITSLCEQAEQMRTTLSADQALHRWLEAVVDEAGQSRGLTAAWRSACQREDLGMEWCKQALDAACTPLLEAAQSAGSAPAVLTVEDVMRLVTAIALATESDPASSGSARRLLGVVLAGFSVASAQKNPIKRPTREGSDENCQAAKPGAQIGSAGKAEKVSVPSRPVRKSTATSRGDRR